MPPQSDPTAPASKRRRRRPTLRRLIEQAAAPLLGTPLTGFVDRIIAGEALGWAFNPSKPQRRVLVVARLGGKVVAETLADLPRRDLEGAGMGDGKCGFRLKLPVDLGQGSLDSLTIEGVAGWRSQRLKRARRFRETPAPPAVAPPTPEQRLTAGFLERCADRLLVGWAVDPNNPEAPADVDIFSGELFLGMTKARIDRPRLREQGAPLGAKGFEFRLPSGREIAPDTLRARIAGTRIDLRRSRSFPGDNALAAEQASAPGEAESAAVGASPVRRGPATPGGIVSERVSFLVCGAGDPAAFEATIAACRAQDWNPCDCAVISDAVASNRSGAPRLGAADDAAVRAFIGRANLVVVLAPGQVVDRDLAHRLSEHDLKADAFCWARPDEDWPRSDPDIALMLGARSSGLAVRADVLAAYAGDLAARLASEGLAWAEAWAAGTALNWSCLDVSASVPAVGARTAAPAALAPARIRRLSLAVWSGWETGEPPALEALLAGASSFDVEVLVPSSVSAELLTKLQAAAPRGARSLSVRPVDAPPHLGEAGLWRAMGHAATGQVVVLCEGSVRPSPEALGDLADWAGRPGIGAVTTAIAGGAETVLSGLRLEARGEGVWATAVPTGAGGAQDRPATAAPAMFMAISRAALADVGGIAADTAGGVADLELGLRLRQVGRRSIVLGRHRADADAARLRPWIERPVPAEILAQFGAEAAPSVGAQPPPGEG